MLCPRCQTPVEAGRCPKCNIVWDADEERQVGSDPAGTSIVMDDPDLPPESSSSDDWRQELRQRLSQHSNRKKSDIPDDEPDSTGVPADVAESGPEAAEEEAPLEIEVAVEKEPPPQLDPAPVPEGIPTKETASAVPAVWESSPDAEDPENSREEAVEPSPAGSFAESPAAPILPSSRPRVIKLREDGPSESTEEGDAEPEKSLPRLSDAPASPVIKPRKPSRPRTPLKNPVRRKESPPVGAAEAGRVFEEPLERVAPSEQTRGNISSVRPRPLPLGEIGTVSSGRPRQRILNLEAAGAGVQETVDIEKSGVRTDSVVERPSAGLLLSRALCGVIDLTLALVLAIAFVLIAAELIGFDFFAPVALVATLLVAASFQAVNSVFFLVAAGQTPGMAATRLRLTAEDPDDEIPLSALLIRVIAFLPALASVVGLLWSFFDARRRCAHDILSGTRVWDEPGP